MAWSHGDSKTIGQMKRSQNVSFSLSCTSLTLHCEKFSIIWNT